MTNSKKRSYLLILLVIFLLLAYVVWVKISGPDVSINKLDSRNKNEQIKKESKTSETATLTQPSFSSLKEGQEAVLEVASQQINGRSVSVSKVITTDDSWLAIYSDNAGQPGNLLGYQAVGVGTAENLRIELAPLPETTSLLAVLHVNLGARERFEYPNGPDMIISKNGQPLITPFSLIQLER